MFAPGVYELVNGICALCAALLIWKITGNFWGWLVLALPGAFLVFAGWWKMLKDR